MSDGATALLFSPPPNSSIRFSQSAVGQYLYQTKDGTALNFGPTPAGALKSWVYPNGMTVTLTYSGNILSTVTNNLGRSLSFSYSGGDVSVVTDDTGRHANYFYDARHNLTTYTDPLGNSTTFAYDTSGLNDTAGHLTQIFYPTHPTQPFVTNSYDVSGRVAAQANANGNVSTFYLAGSRSELIDAVGNRHVTYQSERGRVLMDAYVLSSSFGDVFGDTAQQNGVVNVTLNQYDGIDRLIGGTAPEGDNDAIAYDALNNPWANNIASVTRNPKPGSGLTAIVQTYTYDANWNKVATVTDGLGLITKSVFDGATGNLVRSIADFSTNTGPSSPHLGATNLFTYNGFGQVLTATDPLGVLTVNTYDSFGNLKTITRDSGGLNQETMIGYDALGDAFP